MQFTPKFQGIPLLLGLGTKPDQTQQQDYSYNPYPKGQIESEVNSPNYKNKLPQDASPYHQKKEQYGFNLTPRKIYSKPLLDSLDNFSAYMSTDQSPTKIGHQQGTFTETAKKVMQNSGNASAYGFIDNTETPKSKTKIIPRLEKLNEALTPKNQNFKGEFANLISQVKETIHTERTLGRSQSQNIEFTYGLTMSENEVGGSSILSKKDIHHESPIKLPRIASDSPKKKKTVKFKERIVERNDDKLPSIFFPDDKDEIMIGLSKVRTKFDQHEYLGINLPTVGSQSTNSSTLLLMNIFRKK